MATFGTFTAGSVITASEFNTAGGAWTTFTPSLVNISLGNGTVNYARYEQVGRTVNIGLKITFGSTTTWSGQLGFFLPTNASASPRSNGLVASFYDSSATTYYAGTGIINAANAILFETFNAAGTYLTRVQTSATVPMTWATSDVLEFSGVYEASTDGV